MSLTPITSRGCSAGLLLAMFIACAPVLATPPDAANAPLVDRSRTPEAQAALLNHLKQHLIEFPALPQNHIPQSFQMSVTLDGVARVVTLMRSSVRADNFQALLRMAEGVDIPLAHEPERTYRGTIDDLPAARVAGYLYDNQRVHLSIILGERQWTVQPIDALSPGAHVVYNVQDLVGIPIGTCGVRNGEGPAPTPAPAPPAASPQRGLRGPAPTPSTSRIVILCDSDFEFFEAFGGTSGANAEMQRIINELNSIYDDKGICYVIGTLYTRGSSGVNFSQTDASALLAAFKADWERPPYNTAPQFFRHVAHLFTYKNIDGDIVGIASLAAMRCTTAPVPARSSAYGLSSTPSQSFYPGSQRVEVAAHEIGHNWGLQHCDEGVQGCSGTGRCGIMTSNVSFTGATAFSACSHNTLIGLRAAYAGCATSCGLSGQTICLGGCTYGTVASASGTAPVGSILRVFAHHQDGDGSWPENITLTRPMTYTAGDRPVRIGR